MEQRGSFATKLASKGVWNEEKTRTHKIFHALWQEKTLDNRDRNREYCDVFRY